MIEMACDLCIIVSNPNKRNNISILRFTIFLHLKNYPNKDNICVVTSAKLEN